MSRPYAYMRKSSVRDIAKDISPETQEREVRTLASRFGDNGDALVMLSDWDVSGRAKYTHKRAGYLRLIESIEIGDVSAVYSYSLSRLGRSTAELSRFFDLCASRKVPVRLVADSVDTSTASGRLMANVLGSVAQFEAEVASERLLAMYDTKRARAEAQGLDPRDAVRTSRRYGEVAGEDGSIVLQVFREEGSYSRAARRLNEMGVRPRSAEKWWASSVGVVVERLDPEVARQPKVRGRAKGSKEGFALARLLRCPADGAMLTGSRLPDGKGGKRVRYACRHAESMTHERVSIGEHLIMTAIEAEAALYREDDDASDPASVDVRQDELRHRRQRVVEARLDGLIDRAEAARQVAEIDSEMNRLSSPKAEPFRWPHQWTPREMNDVLRQLFERIDLDPKTFQPVTFIWRDPARRAA